MNIGVRRMENVYDILNKYSKGHARADGKEGNVLYGADKAF